MPDVKANSIRNMGTTFKVFDNVNWDYQTQSLINYSDADLQNGVVVWLDFIGIKGTILGALINKFGSPDSVFAQPVKVEVGYTFISLIYAKIGIILQYQTRYCNNNNVRLLAGDNVSYIDFFSPEKFDILFNTGYLFGNISADRFKRELRPWIGFTDYQCVS